MSSGSVRRVQPAPVKKQLFVQASPERAFDVFTTGFSMWWPPSHHIGLAAYQTAIIEPHVGGRWYEVGEDGSECDWGDVLAWDPPELLILAWRLGADWKYDKDLLTEIEVRFTADGARTRVDFEHRKLENWGVAAEQARNAIDSEGGWGGLLGMYSAAVQAR